MCCKATDSHYNNIILTRCVLYEITWTIELVNALFFFLSFFYSNMHKKSWMSWWVLCYIFKTKCVFCKFSSIHVRHWQHLGTQDTGLRQTKHNTTQKIKKMRNTDSTKNRVWTQVLTKGKQFPPCYSYSPDVLDITRCKQTQITSDCLLKMWIVEQTVFFCRYANMSNEVNQ